MKFAPRPLLIAAALVAASGPPPNATPVDASRVTLIRVPHNGIQPEAIVDRGGILHLLTSRGTARRKSVLRAVDRFWLDLLRPYSREQSGRQRHRDRDNPRRPVRNRTRRPHPCRLERIGHGNPRGLINPANDQPGMPFLYTRSNADGTAFEPQRSLTRRTFGVDGGGSIAADADGRVFAAWHALAVGGPQGEDNRRVWLARSTDEGATFADEEPASREPTGACGCCGLRLFTSSSSLYLLYRSATSLTHRDIYVLESSDQVDRFAAHACSPGKSTPVR
jgi:hypothetical protein